MASALPLGAGAAAQGVNAEESLPAELFVGDGDVCGVELAHPAPGEFRWALTLTDSQQPSQLMN